MFSNLTHGNNEEDSFLYLCQIGAYEKARFKLNSIEDKNLLIQLRNYLDVIQYGKFNQINLDEELDLSSDNHASAIFKINKSLKYYLQEGSELKAYRLLKESLEISERLNHKALIGLNSKLLLEIYSRTLFTLNDISYKYVIKNFKEHALNDYDKKIAEFYDYKITMRFFFNDSLNAVTKKYKKVNALFRNDTLNFNTAKLHLTNSAYHNRITKNIDSSLYYLGKAEKFLKSQKGYFENEKYNALQVNLASLLFLQKKYKKSLVVLNKINNDNSDYIYQILDSYVNFYKYQNYNALGDSLNALRYHNNALSQQLVQNQTKNLQLVSEYETKYEAEKKENENLLLETKNLEIETKRIRNKNLLFGALALIAFGSIVFYLIQKNTKRKQKLAEQEKEIESQKLATVLKEQELTAIDAMIEGQEKERQRIANDLHDDLGGLMATVKLHFNALKDKGSPELFDKTNNLIEEAYQKVRSVAHAKNSGVIAKQGLLKAIQNMAEKISASNKIQIDVLDHGLDNRLENSLELTLFRVIQELITNVIKHAEATEATIHLTNHEDSINIMVEDNGVGFVTKHISKKSSGMGISSIDKRVEHLDGKLTIESEKNKGTTIIIDIPL